MKPINSGIRQKIWYQVEAQMNTRMMVQSLSRSAHRDPHEGLWKILQKFNFFRDYFVVVVYSARLTAHVICGSYKSAPIAARF